MQKKPKALVFAHPYEGRTSYFLAGLSHHYELDIYYVTNKRFRFVWQVFYKWQYSKDVKFIHCQSIKEFDNSSGKYDAAFLFLESFHFFLPWPLGQEEILASLRQLKARVRDIYWLEIGERQYFTFGRQEFWDLVSGVLKGQLFKRQYEYILKDKEKISLFQDPKLAAFSELVKENEILDLDKYRHKIIPFPFTPTITDLAKYNLSGAKKIYDWAANTRTVGNGKMRYEVIEYLEKNLPKKYSYSIEYHKLRHSVNLLGEKKPFDIYLTPYIGKWLFKVGFGKYFYAQPLYWHNLLRSKCYLGLGFTFSSLRTADVWGAGSVLLNFSFKKCEYGLPVEDGYNYVSLGERDEMSKDLLSFKAEFGPAILDKTQSILSDPVKQRQIVKNQLDSFEQYYASPEQFVKKIFLEKIAFFS